MEDRAATVTKEDSLALEAEQAALRKRELDLWYHKHVRCAGTLGVHMAASPPSSSTAEEENDASSSRSMWFIIPFADCVDAMLRVMVLSVGCSNSLLCFSMRPSPPLTTPSLKLVHDANPGHEAGDGGGKFGDARSTAYVQIRGRQAVAILEDKYKRIRVVSVLNWNQTLATVLLPDDGLVHSIVALKDRSMVAVTTCTSTKMLFIVDLEAAACVRLIHRQQGRVRRWWPTGLCLLPDGLLAVADCTGGIEILDPNTGRSAATVHFNPKNMSEPNDYVDESARPPGYKLINIADRLADDYKVVRPSRIGVVRRLRTPSAAEISTSESSNNVFSNTLDEAPEYDLLVIDDDDAKTMFRVSYPDFEPIGPVATFDSIKHLYGAECGGVWPISGGKLAFLDHGTNGKISIIDLGDKEAKPITSTADGENPPVVVKRALGLTMIPLPDAVIEV